jgi:hypothetical protein
MMQTKRLNDNLLLNLMTHPVQKKPKKASPAAVVKKDIEIEVEFS